MKIDSVKIKIILGGLNLSGKELAEKIGVTPQNLSAILTRGSCHPKTAARIARGLGVPVEEIIVKE